MQPRLLQPRSLRPARFCPLLEILEGRAVPSVDLLVNNNNGYNGISTYFTQSETTLVAAGNTVVIGFNDSGSYNGGGHFTGFSYSSDGGATFTDGGTLPASAFGDAGDPVLARDDTTGRIYFATLQLTGSGIDVFHSDNGGATWSAPAQGAPGKANGLQDKEWMAVDNFPGLPGSGKGNVYLMERDFGTGNGTYIYRSTDGGTTFGPSGGTLIASGAAGNVQGAFVTVGLDHAVYAFWFDDVTNVIQVRKSTDQGATFGAPVTVVSGLVGGVNGDLFLTGLRQGTATYATFRSNEFPHAAVNPVNGNIYVTYANDGAGVDKADAFVVQSADGGATWSAPTKVNDDATTTDQWFPTLAVTPDGANLGIFYYSRQEDPVNNNLFKYYGRIASISGATLTFQPSFAISDVASLPEFGRDTVVNSTYMGDYNQAVATPGAFHVVWSDNRDNLNVPPNPNKDPNVYYEMILLAAPPTPTISIDDVTQVEGNNGTTTFSFTVSLSGPAAGTVTVQYATADGTATAPSDYTAVTLTTLTFNPGETSKPATVTVNGDTTVEPDETFFVNLSNPSGATIADGQGVGTILNDDTAPPPLTLSINDVTQLEGNNGNTTFSFTISLSGPAAGTVTVQYATTDGTASSASGRGKDYNGTSGTLTFRPGQTSKTVAVSVKGDRNVEGDETFFVNLSNPSGATIADGQGVGTILNDDGVAASGGAFGGTFLDGLALLDTDTVNALLAAPGQVPPASTSAGSRPPDDPEPVPLPRPAPDRADQVFVLLSQEEHAVLRRSRAFSLLEAD